MTAIQKVKFSKKVGRIRATDVDYLWMPEEPYAGYPVVLLHGAGTLTRDSFASAAFWGTATLAPILASHGIPVLAGWMAGDSMANDLHMTTVEACKTFWGTQAGVNSAKMHLMGISMGAGVGVRYTSLNPAKVASLLGLIPFSNPQAVYVADRGSFRATIAAAWGVTYPAALPSQADFIGVHAPAIAAANVPRRILYSSADVLVLPSEAQALAAGMGITPEVVDATYGHAEQTTYQASQLGVAGGGSTWQDYENWIRNVDGLAGT